MLFGYPLRIIRGAQCFILHRAILVTRVYDTRASEIWLHREYNLAMKNKSLRRIADMRSGMRLRAAHAVGGIRIPELSVVWKPEPG